MRTTKHVSLSKTATPDNITRQFSCPKQLRTTKHVSLSEERAKREHTPRWRSGGGRGVEHGGRVRQTDRQTEIETETERDNDGARDPTERASNRSITERETEIVLVGLSSTCI